MPHFLISNVELSSMYLSWLLTDGQEITQISNAIPSIRHHKGYILKCTNFKATQYCDLKHQIKDNDRNCHVYPVEVGRRGFGNWSTLKFLNVICVALHIRQTTIKKLLETAETTSSWTWNNRDRMETDQKWHSSHAHYHLLEASFTNMV